jgi:hypothetical protein
MGTSRRMFGLVCACTGVFLYLFITVYLDYIKGIQKCKYVKFDVQTITAADYTIEFDLP